MIDFINLENYRNISTKRNFDLRKITVLIGPNNSGKSSLIKSLLLLKASLKQIDILKFQDEIHKLGDFKSILSSERIGEDILFELPFDLIGSGLIKLRYTGKNNELNNGLLTSIEIEHNEINVLKITNINYATDESDVAHMQYYINYEAFFQYFSRIDQEEAERIQNINDHLLKSNTPQAKQVTNFDFKFEENIFQIVFEETNLNSNLMLEREYIRQVLSSPRFSNIHSEEYRFNFISILSAEINFEKRGNWNGISVFKSDFEKTHFIKQIKFTENGKHFLDRINSTIRNSFKHFENEFMKLKYIATSETKQERLHHSTNNPFLNLLTIFLNNSDINKIKFVNDWMQKLNLLELNEQIQINRYAQTGYEVLIKNLQNGNLKNIADCGFGLSQILTLLLQLSNNKFSQFLIEEPEANLHPALQSQLADLFCSLIHQNSFIIETHSEYMVRKFQYLVAQGKLNPEEIIIHYFWKNDEVSNSKQIEILPNGQLSESFEKGFYDEAINLKFELLKLIKEQSN